MGILGIYSGSINDQNSFRREDLQISHVVDGIETIRQDQLPQVRFFCCKGMLSLVEKIVHIFNKAVKISKSLGQHSFEFFV